MANSPRIVQWTVRIYKTLIKSYPASFNKKYGDEMVVIFRELAADAHRRRGIVGLIAACFCVLLDLARTVPKEHLTEWNNQGEIAMSFRSLLTRKIGPDHINPRWSRMWVIVFSFILTALYIKALTNMKLTNFELICGILLIMAMTLQGIFYGLLLPLFHQTNSSRYNNSISQIAIYAASVIVMTLGILGLMSIVQTEFQVFIGVLLSLNVMMNGCCIAGILPILQANSTKNIEQQQTKRTVTNS